MTQPASVRVSIIVEVDVEAAFRAFTDEIDAWYKRGPHSFYDANRALGLRFEPFVGGRLIEVYDADSGEGREMGRVEIWDPPNRLQYRDMRDTEVDVRFESYGERTEVTLEHRGLERLAPSVAQHVRDFGGALLMTWFDEYMASAA